MSFIKRINKEIQLYEKSNFIFDNLILQYKEDDLHTWYFIIYNLKDTDYENGIYLGEVSLPDTYPFKAPDFKFLTHTGRFEINKKLCTTFTGFHNDQWCPSWNICSMCAGLTSFMTDAQNTTESKGIGGIETTKEEKQKIALKSRDTIKNNEIFNNYFKKFETILKI